MPRPAANASATGTHPGLRVATEMIETDATNTNGAEALTGYGSIVSGVFYENLLPDAAGGPPRCCPAPTRASFVSASCTFKYPPVRRQPRGS